MSSVISQCKKVICVGRNYLAHVKELNNKLPSEPLLFTKPRTSLLGVQSGPILMPPLCTSFHHEVELGIVIGMAGKNIHPNQADSYIKGYVLALDMTDRSAQDVIKKGGLPWDTAKALDTFTPVGDFIPKEKIGDHQNLQLWLKVNGEMKQNGNTANMLFPIPYLISYISTLFSLEDGDVILSGTPDGVGPVLPGQVHTRCVYAYIILCIHMLIRT